MSYMYLIRCKLRFILKVINFDISALLNSVFYQLSNLSKRDCCCVGMKGALCQSTGPNCRSDCYSTPNGNYQWCGRCDYFLQCSGGSEYYTECPSDLYYDDSTKSCEVSSTTCFQSPCYQDLTTAISTAIVSITTVPTTTVRTTTVPTTTVPTTTVPTTGCKYCYLPFISTR